MQENIGAGLGVGAEADLRAIAAMGLGMKSVYRIECVGPDGEVKWVEEVANLVTDAGLNDLLDKYFKGSSYTAAFYVGLKGSGTIAAGDTLASHGGWTEVTAYSGNRKALTLGSVSGQSVDNSASKASFAINADDTEIAGGFVCTAASGTSGVLYGAANFTSPRDADNGDTLNVQITLTASAV